MADMLVRLYALPELAAQRARTEASGVTVRRPNAWEKPLLLAWVREQFGDGWGAECEVAFATRPPSCFVAIEGDVLIGFACHDCTRRNFFGPTGVAGNARRRGVGTTLLLSCLHAMAERGYAYAIIGGLGPSAFYAKTVGAMPIEGSTPGIYDFRLTGARYEPDQAR
jgi:hypothetical protein